MHLSVAAETIGEYRARGLVVEGREVSVALQAVLLAVHLAEHATVAAAVWDMADHATVTPTGLVRVDEGSPVLAVALHASVLAEFAVMKPMPRAMCIVTVGAEHPSLRNRVMVGLTELCGDSRMALLTVLVRVLAQGPFCRRRRVAGQAGHLATVVRPGPRMPGRGLVAGHAGGLLRLGRATSQ